MYDGIKIYAIPPSEAYTEFYEEASRGAYTSYIRGKRCRTETDFLIEVSSAFQFPYYYGENWPAFDECIQDLEWIHSSRFFVLFDDFSQAFRDQKELQNLLQDRVKAYFTRAILYWRSRGISMEVWLNN